MISVLDALNIIKNSQIKTKIVEVNVIDALNYFLAENIYASINMPPFSQSAMDGYALCGDENQYKVIGEIKAGDTHQFKLKQGEAYRIFTGAMIPENTTSIAKQEIVDVRNNLVKLTEIVKPGTSIRKEGEELKKGDIVLKQGSKLSPAAIGLISGLGISKVKVYEQPKVALIVTGNELTRIGNTLLPGKIYESNSFTIKSALLNLGIKCELHFVKDTFESTRTVIANALETKNVVIITGGISVGDYDFVGKALNDLQVKQQFYKVKQKPGKPLFYGEKNKTKVFGLPGNPAAALTSFYVYIVPAINTMMGSSSPELLNVKVKLAHNYTKKGDRAHFLKAQVKGNEVTVNQGQSSAMLSSFANANCFLFIDETQTEIKKGTLLNVLMLP